MAHAGQLHHNNLGQSRSKSQLNGSNNNLVHGLHACLRPPTASSFSALHDAPNAQTHNEWPLLGWAAHAVPHISGQIMICIPTDDATIILCVQSGPEQCFACRYQDPVDGSPAVLVKRYNITQQKETEMQLSAQQEALQRCACMHACCLLQRRSTYPCQECLLAATVQRVLTCFLLSCGLLSECLYTWFTRIK